MDDETVSFYGENKFDLITSRLSIYESPNVHAMNKIKKVRTKEQYASIYIISDLFIIFNTFISSEGHFNYSRLSNTIIYDNKEDKSFIKGTKEFSNFGSKTRTNYIMNATSIKKDFITVIDKEERLTTALNQYVYL